LENEKAEYSGETGGEQQSMFKSVMKHFTGLSVGSDVPSNNDLGAELVNSMSMLELIRKYSLVGADYLVHAASCESPLERILAVTEYIITSVQIEKSGKKPLNPIWGEYCFGEVHHDDKSVTRILSEQVSHHPPISATSMRNDKHGIIMEPFISKSSLSFWGTYLNIHLKGEKELKIKK